MAERLHPALRELSDAVLAVAAQRSVDEVLQGLVDRARELAGARYAALGIPDGDGGFSRFLVSGMSDELVAALGPLPRTHGMLGAMLETTQSFRTTDIHDDPRFRGWWPKRHPDMRSFLGVPIATRDGVIGAFYLTEKTGAAEFTDADQRPSEITLELADELAADPERDPEILRIAQEALHNALRHAQADHVAVRLRTDDGRLLPEVADDGVGFHPSAPE